MELLLLLEYFSTILATSCIPINLVFLHILYKYRRKRPFTSSFFELCRTLTIVDILMMIFSTVFFKLPVYGWIPSHLFHDNFAVIPMMGIKYFGHVQAIGIIGIALNRFTAVFSPIRHRDYWWTPTKLMIFAILQWTIPILIILPLFFTKFEKVPNKHTGGVLFNVVDHTFHQVSYWFKVILYFKIYFMINSHVFSDILSWNSNS